MVDDFEDGDETHAHGESKDTTNIGDEPNQGHLLISLHPRHGRILDVNIHQCQVFPGILVYDSGEPIVEIVPPSYNISK